MTAGELVDRAGEAAHRSAAGLGPAGEAARDSFRAPGSGQESLLSRLFGWLGERMGSLFPDVAWAARSPACWAGRSSAAWQPG